MASSGCGRRSRPGTASCSRRITAAVRSDGPFPLGLAVGAPIQSWRAGLFMGADSIVDVAARRRVQRLSRRTGPRGVKCAIQILTDAKRPLVLFPEASSRARTIGSPPDGRDGSHRAQRGEAARPAIAGGQGRDASGAIRRDTSSSGRSAPRWAGPRGNRTAVVVAPSDRPAHARSHHPGGRSAADPEGARYEGRRGGHHRHRIELLIDRLLGPLEQEWPRQARGGHRRPRESVARRDCAGSRRRKGRRGRAPARRWRELADIYSGAAAGLLSTRLRRQPRDAGAVLETVERFEEDLTDSRAHPSAAARGDRSGRGDRRPPGRGPRQRERSLMVDLRHGIETDAGAAARAPAGGGDSMSRSARRHCSSSWLRELWRRLRILAMGRKSRGRRWSPRRPRRRCFACSRSGSASVAWFTSQSIISARGMRDGLIGDAVTTGRRRWHAWLARTPGRGQHPAHHEQRLHRSVRPLPARVVARRTVAPPASRCWCSSPFARSRNSPARCRRAGMIWRRPACPRCS